MFNFTEEEMELAKKYTYTSQKNAKEIFENNIKIYFIPKSFFYDIKNRVEIWKANTDKNFDQLVKETQNNSKFINKKIGFSVPKNEKPYTSSLKINQQLENLGNINTWFTKKEIKYLPELIREDEIIKGLASGYLDGNTWIIVVTTQRLLFLDKGMLYGLKQMEMDYGQISAVSHSIGLISASITVSTSGGTKKIDNIQKSDAYKISQLISNLIRESKKTIQQVTSSGNFDIASQLEKLANLLEKGILTQEEFQSQKMKLLDQ